MKTIEGNKLIAEFMGLKVNPNEDYYKNHVNYSSCWSYLMPVVEKIENGQFSVQIENKDCIIWRTNPRKEFRIFQAETKTQAVYKVVIEFIEWYNEQPTVRGQP